MPRSATIGETRSAESEDGMKEFLQALEVNDLIILLVVGVLARVIASTVGAGATRPGTSPSALSACGCCTS